MLKVAAAVAAIAYATYSIAETYTRAMPHPYDDAPAGAVAYVPQPCLRAAQWGKLAWNAPFNGCTVLAGGADVGKLWGDAEGKATAVAIMREVIRAANADLAAHGAAPRLDAVCCAPLDATKASPVWA